MNSLEEVRRACHSSGVVPGESLLTLRQKSASSRGRDTRICSEDGDSGAAGGQSLSSVWSGAKLILPGVPKEPLTDSDIFSIPGNGEGVGLACKPGA